VEGQSSRPQSGGVVRAPESDDIAGAFVDGSAPASVTPEFRLPRNDFISPLFAEELRKSLDPAQDHCNIPLKGLTGELASLTLLEGDVASRKT
jgi:hypothetical protein